MSACFYGRHGASFVSEAAAVILMYHRISEVGADRSLLSVPPAEYRAQMKYLRDADFRVLSLEELAVGLRMEMLPPRAVALTFDDGYLDSLTTVSVVLAEYQMPAAFFVVTAMHERPHEFWWDALERAFDGERRLPERLEVTLTNLRLSLRTSTADERGVARDRIKRTFFKLSREEREDIVDFLLRWSGAGQRGTSVSRAMTAAEIRTLVRIPGMSVGSHTVNHLHLPSQRPIVKFSELVESKRSLEQLLDRDITTLSYPYGAFDAETVAMARGSGYRCAVSTGSAALVTGSDVFGLPRIAVRSGDDLPARLQRIFRFG